MPLNIQILLSALDNLVANQAQLTFNSRCLSTPGTMFIDSANVRSITHTVDRDAVGFSITAQVLTVTQASLDASLDGRDPVRDELSRQVNLRLAADGQRLSITCTSITPPTPGFRVFEDEVLGSFDLRALFQTLGASPPSQTIFEAAADSLFIRFDPTQEPPVNHLFLGMEWCVFIDASGMEALAIDFVTRAAAPQFLAKDISPNPARAIWAPKGPGPSGLIPHVRAAITGRGHRSCLWFTAEATFNIDFYFQPLLLLGPSLVEYVNWNLSILVDETLGILFWAQGKANDEAAQAMRDFDPTTVRGGSRLGAPGTDFGVRNFQVANSLPGLAFGTAGLGFNKCMAFREGMALGGPVDQGNPPSQFNTHFNTTKFPYEFTQYLSCKSNSRAGTSVTAVSTSNHVGRICAVDIISPPHDRVDVLPYMSVSPPPETTTDNVSISFTFSDVVAFQVSTNKQDVVVRVRTTRGVRMINFGRPPVPEWDDKGNVKNAQIVLLDDCTKKLGAIRWKIPHSILSKIWLVDPPPIWVDRIEDVSAFESSLINVPVREGESVIFNQPRDGGMSIISATSRAGIATVPALLAVRSFDEGASLETMNRSDIGQVMSTSKMFRRVAVLNKKGSISHQLIGNKTTARVITTFQDRVEMTEIDDLGSCRVISVQKGQYKAREEQSEEVKTKAHCSPATKKKFPDIPGCIATHPVPGFDDHSTSIAEFEDGSYRVLSRNEDGTFTVTGMVPRWPKMPPISGDWAISRTHGDRIAVFSVMQTGPKMCTCKCQCGAEAVQVAK
jgi:hypothetical protein